MSKMATKTSSRNPMRNPFSQLAGPELRLAAWGLASTVTVRHIMTTESQLVCGLSESDAANMCLKNPDFDVIPVRSSTDIESYVPQGSDTAQPIHKADLISDRTTILELVPLLKERPFRFVRVRGQVGGYVHFSDLNNPLTKVPFFVIITALEYRLARLLEKKLVDGFPRGVALEHNLDKYQSEFKKLRAGDANLDLSCVLYFNDTLLLASHFGLIGRNTGSEKGLNTFRNHVAHPNRPLVEKHDDVGQLESWLSSCRTLLDGLK